MAFAERQINVLGENPELLGNLFFSDEAHFYLNGEVNRWNFRLWSDENPHWFTEDPLHPEKVTVWLGVGLNGFVGPFFWDSDSQFPGERGINARWYEAMLTDQAIPALRRWPNFRQLFFQQDGAPAHYALSVRQLLDREFPGRWMGRGSVRHSAPVAWPPRSPDLTPLDFWVWGDMKQRIFTQDFRPRTVAELKESIRRVVAEMNEDRETRIEVFNEYQRRLRECIRRGGQSVERR